MSATPDLPDRIAAAFMDIFRERGAGAVAETLRDARAVMREHDASAELLHGTDVAAARAEVVEHLAPSLHAPPMRGRT